jgi:anti-anti-sigma regulatory factor
VVDARRLSFVDSSGLKAFVTLHRKVPVRIVTAEDSRLRRLLNLTGIDIVIEVYGSVDEALAG